MEGSVDPVVVRKEFKSVAPVHRPDGILLRTYQNEEDMKAIIAMMERDLSGKKLNSKVMLIVSNPSLVIVKSLTPFLPIVTLFRTGLT